MRSVIATGMTCILSLQLAAQVPVGFKKIPVKFSVSGKEWIIRQLQKAHPGQTILYARTTTSSCGNNYGCMTVVPVTKLELSGTRMDEGKVKLNWETLAEFNNKGFNVERRFSQSGDFSFVHFVPGKINPQTLNQYALTDANNFTGITYYRLKQLDIDGRFNYSNTIAVKGYGQEFAVTPYPNPSTGNNIDFRISGLKPGTPMNISIHDNLGRTIYAKQQLPLSNTYIFNWTRDVLSPGVYHISLVADDKKTSSTFIIAH